MLWVPCSVAVPICTIQHASTCSGSVCCPEDRDQGRKVHPLLALRHSACVNLLRVRDGRASLVCLDQVDERLRCLCTHVPHRRNDFAASTETLFGRQRVLIRNHLGRSARPAEEIVERTRIKALEPIGCLAVARTHRPDLFLPCRGNVSSVSPPA